MAGPIRWDTIMSRPDNSSVQGINSAAQLITGGLAQLTAAGKTFEDTDNANFANHKKLNTGAFQDALMQYQDPEDLKKAMAPDGALAQLRASLGPNIDNDAIRGAAEQRVTGLMDQKVKSIAFDHTMKDERVAPLLDRFKQAIMSGKPDVAAALEGEYAQMGGRDLAGLSAFRDQRQAQITERGLAMQKGEDDHLRSQSDIQHSRAMESLQASANAVAARNAETQAQSVAQQGKSIDFAIRTGTEDRNNAIAAGKAQGVKTALREAGNMYADGVYNGNQAPELIEFMTKNKIGSDDPSKRANVLDFVNRLSREGVQIKDSKGAVVQTIHDIPMSVIKQAISGSSDGFFNSLGDWNTTNAKETKAAIIAAMSATNSPDGGKTRTNKAMDDLRMYVKAVDNSAENAPAIRSTGMPAVGAKKKY